MMFSQLITCTARLDARAFLGLRVWKFFLVNFFRAFPWYFLFRIAMPHPFRVWRGLQRYRKLVEKANWRPLAGTGDFRFVLSNQQDQDQSFLIAPGFCMKPFDYANGRSTCPAGHFNHACALLDRGGGMLFEPERWPVPCLSCGIAPLAQLAAKRRADIYIMTSAMDIARHVYLPALKRGNPQIGLFFLCAYSSEPFTFGLAVSGIEGVLVEFCRGDCKNHIDWTNADVGLKHDQTFVDPQKWHAILNVAGDAPDVAAGAGLHFSRVGEVYRYCGDES